MAAWTERSGMGARCSLFAALDGPGINSEWQTITLSERGLNKTLTLIRWKHVARLEPQIPERRCRLLAESGPYFPPISADLNVRFRGKQTFAK